MRKYDRRQYNGRQPNQQKPGRKPLYLKQLSRCSAAKTLKAFEAIAGFEQVYARAWEKGNETLCAQLWLRVEDRIYGKPFTAENPEAKAKGNVFYTDKRLQVAIQQLLPAPGAQKLPRTRSKALPAAAGTIEANPEGQQEPAGQSEGD